MCGRRLAAVVAMLARSRAEEAPRSRAEIPDDQRWQAVAPGRVEPWSGEIKIAAPVVGRIGEVLVNVNDKVFAGEPLVRLDDERGPGADRDRRGTDRAAQARPQRPVRRRAARPSGAGPRIGSPTPSKALVDAQAARRPGGDRRGGRARGSDADLAAARAALSREQDRLKQRQAELRRLEDDKNTPLPTQNEGQLNVARAELLLAQAAIEKLTIRAPIAGTVLQVNAKAGELASPPRRQPLMLIGDISDAARARRARRARFRGDQDRAAGPGAGFRVSRTRVRRQGGLHCAARRCRAHQCARSARPDRRRVVEVLVDLAEPGPLAVGMKVDVYFRPDVPQH